MVNDQRTTQAAGGRGPISTSPPRSPCLIELGGVSVDCLFTPLALPPWLVQRAEEKKDEVGNTTHEGDDSNPNHGAE